MMKPPKKTTDMATLTTSLTQRTCEEQVREYQYQRSPSAQLFTSIVNGVTDTAPHYQSDGKQLRLGLVTNSTLVEEEIFSTRAKMFILDQTYKWVYYGWGNVKFLKHLAKGSIRLFMWEDSSKLRANHWITGDMNLWPSSVYKCNDASDGEPKLENF